MSVTTHPPTATILILSPPNHPPLRLCCLSVGVEERHQSHLRLYSHFHVGFLKWFCQCPLLEQKALFLVLQELMEYLKLKGDFLSFNFHLCLKLIEISGHTDTKEITCTFPFTHWPQMLPHNSPFVWFCSHHIPTLREFKRRDKI